MPPSIPVIEKKSVKKTLRSTNDFPIVAIGASSGGLEAVTDLLKYLPCDTGMAYIFIQHLSPDHKSILTSLLSKATKMKVQEIMDMELMEPDNVYVIPYNKGIKVTDGHIMLTRRSVKSPTVSIDILFTSLAETHKEDAIGIVLSGNASDGTNGLRAIKQEGGITFAQDDTARYSSMPDSAIQEGVADFVMSPKEIALELARMGKEGYKTGKISEAQSQMEIEDANPDLKTILQLLHQRVGVDFNQYKPGTIKRRIVRRIFLYKLKNIKQYLKLLQTKNEEIDVLYKDMLIHVTHFFREKGTFQYLKTTLFPKLLRNKKADEKLRIWVTACSTGQEAYSMAMLLIEILGEDAARQQVQIFGTDISDEAIKKARSGQYAKYDLKEVSAKRIERFFVKEGNNYKIAKSVRDICSFAPHNILSDPPFSHMDFISCCNLLIYLSPAVHTKVLSTFHYALNNGGCLMLSRSEAITSTKFFLHINKDYKIFDRRKGIHSLPDLVREVRNPPKGKGASLSYQKPTEINSELDSSINSILFSQYIPAYLIVNQAKEILQFKGATSKYLEHSTGKATLNLMNMIRPEIAFQLRDSLNKAIETKQAISKPGIEMNSDTHSTIITPDVIPLNIEVDDFYLLVVFTEQGERKDNTSGSGKVSLKEQSSLKKMKTELTNVKNQLLYMSMENEKSNRILQNANDEILSSNEEFQSLNEEMETSKEEIESANQELITTNQELQTRNEQLAEAHDLSEAIITTLHEPILILDKNLRVKTSNNAFYKKFQMSKSDVDGKLLYEMGNNLWRIPRLRELLEKIIPKNTYFSDYEITHEFPVIGQRTMLLNGIQMVQQVNNERLILLAFTDITEKTRERNAEKKELKDLVDEKTKSLMQSYRDLEEKTHTLEKLNKDLETFSFISSHDLQEPLRKIRNFAALLLKEENSNLSIGGKEICKEYRIP